MSEPGHILTDHTPPLQRLERENRALKGIIMAAIQHSMHGAVYTTSEEIENLADLYDLSISSDNTLVDQRVKIEMVPIQVQPAVKRSEARFTGIEGVDREVWVNNA